jgi:hypothetical protein
MDTDEVLQAKPGKSEEVKYLRNFSLESGGYSLVG